MARGAPLPASAAGVYRTTGVIVEIEADSLTLDHAPVPALKWPAMTMPFKLGDKALASGLKKGQSVEFSFDKHGEDYRITAIAPISGASAAGAGAGVRR
jgi:Cu(I)/Ag(I) efflux system membrane fusion protein